MTTPTTEKPKKPSPPIRSNCCEAWWTGIAAAHCSGCHRTFTSTGTFDRHRRGGVCLDPASVVTKKGDPVFPVAERKWPGWSMAGSWSGPDDAFVPPRFVGVESDDAGNVRVAEADL